MDLAVKLVDDGVPARPCGLIADIGFLTKLAPRIAALDGFLLARQNAKFILYHPHATDPDLPWLGDDIIYLNRYSHGLYGPAGSRLNIPAHMLAQFRVDITSRKGFKGDLLMLSADELKVVDLSPAMPVHRVDLDAMMGQVN